MHRDRRIQPQRAPRTPGETEDNKFDPNPKTLPFQCLCPIRPLCEYPTPHPRAYASLAPVLAPSGDSLRPLLSHHGSSRGCRRAVHVRDSARAAARRRLRPGGRMPTSPACKRFIRKGALALQPDHAQEVVLVHVLQVVQFHDDFPSLPAFRRIGGPPKTPSKFIFYARQCGHRAMRGAAPQASRSAASKAHRPG